MVVAARGIARALGSSDRSLRKLDLTDGMQAGQDAKTL